LFDTIVEAEFKDGPGAFPETTLLDDQTLGDLLAQVQGLTKIAEDLKAEAQRRLYRGGSVPGYQLVSYTPPRKWTATAAEKLIDVLEEEDVEQLWKRSLITPTQAIKTLKAIGYEDPDDALVELIDVPEKRPVIAPEGDRRKTWQGRAPEDMFAVEDE